MGTEPFLDRHRFFIAISDMLDLASPQLTIHQVRTAFISWKLSEMADLSPEDLDDVFTAALVHDVGALTPEEKVDVHESNYADIEVHCIRGARLIRNVPHFGPVAEIIRHHHRPWLEWCQVNANKTSLQAQIVCLADTVERYIRRDRYILLQEEDITARIIADSGSIFDPVLVDMFRELAVKEDFWLDLVSPRLVPNLLENIAEASSDVPQSSMLTLSEFIRELIDFRSPFTATHSAGVSAAAAALAIYADFTEEEVESIKIAGNLHDVGKMVVPNRILEKPDKLTKDEFAVMRQHTYHTYHILTRCSLNHGISKWAGFHHEKLDGSGYPFHLHSQYLDTGARIMAVADIFTALAEDRPYREGMTREKALAIITRMADDHLIDGEVTSLLASNYDEVVGETLEAQRRSREEYDRVLL